jgi:hypothetical protein
MSKKLDPTQLAYEVALGYHTPDELCTRFDLDPALLAALQADPRFQRAVVVAKREIDDMGTEFQVKARKLASLVIDELGTIAINPLATASDRISAIRELARFAGYAAMAENPVHRPAHPVPEMPEDDEQAKAYIIKMLGSIVRNADGRSTPSECMSAAKEIARLKGMVVEPGLAINNFVALVPPKAQDTAAWVKDVRPAAPTAVLEGTVP